MSNRMILPRRRFLRWSAAGAVALSPLSPFLTTRGAFAEELVQTPNNRSLEGPFYPDKMPLDTDNDLLIINDSITPAVGEITHLTGRVMSRTGSPIRNAFVEIWQVDSHASYIHSKGRNEKQDANFQGYGRFLTDVEGRYYFRTIKPVPYGMSNVFRAPHIHVAVSRHGKRIFTSQILINGHEANQRDGLTQQIRDPLAKETILVDFKPIEDSKIGELSANFDIVLGKTLEELEDGTLGWGLGKSGMGPGARRGS